ncbi:MAG: hypothetical protein ACFFC7_07580 [Candidatus Hermodarchaeota archaeon]
MAGSSCRSDVKSNSRIKQNLIAILNHWIYGFNKTASEFDLGDPFFYEVGKKIIYSVLQDKIGSVEFKSALDICKWYDNQLKAKKFRLAEKITFKADPQGIKAEIRGCVFLRSCLNEAAADLPHYCYCALTFAVCLMIQSDKRYDTFIEHFSTLGICHILISERQLLQTNHFIDKIMLINQTFPIGISVIKLGDEGPKLLISTPLYFLEDSLEKTVTEFLNSVVIYYLTSIAQASAYHEGLFGPLPVKGHQNQEVMLFGFRKRDASLKDPRFKGYGYFFFCIFFQKGNANIVPRSRLESFLKEYTSQIKNISQLTKDLLLELVIRITTLFYY